MKREEAIKELRSFLGQLTEGCQEVIKVLIPELKEESEDERIKKEINILYADIDACITELLKARTDKDSEAEGKAIFKMEGLMVATLQDLSCIEDYLEKQKSDRMKPIYDARESFESALEKAWNDYHNGYENVDKLEDDYMECAHAKGFREGYLFGIEKQKAAETPQWMIDFLNDILSSCIIYDDYVRRQEYQSKVLGIIKWLENQKAKTPQWIIDFLKEIRPYSINKEEYEGYAGRIEFESKILTIIKWLEGNPIQQKEQEPITESKRLANEVIEYLIRCGYSPVLKDDSKKEHFHIDIPRHEDDFWHSEEYKHCRSVLGEYYMEGDYGGDTYTLYIWRAKKEQKHAEWSEFDRGALNDAICAVDLLGNDESYNKSNPNLAKAFRVAKDWLKSLPERFNLQPKNEWSEEDEEALDMCLDVIPKKWTTKSGTLLTKWLKDNIHLKQEWGEEDNKIIYDAYLWLCEYAGSLTQKNQEKSSMLYKTANRLKSLRPQPKQEWSEEDKHRCKDAIYFLETAKKHYADTSEIELTIEWLKSLQTQPKQEWSEDIIRRGIKEVGLTQYQINWFKNNVFPPKEEQKPVEWSEIDEENRKFAIDWLNFYKTNYASQEFTKEEIDEIIAWLKSLK